MSASSSAGEVRTPWLEFYRGRGRDARGRTLDEILAWDFDTLEFTHDYIQWLFPLPEASAFNPEAPLLDATQIAAFRSGPTLKQRLLDSLRLMLRFYGLKDEERNDRSVLITRRPDFAARSENWLTPSNHNFLRLTRILRSLCLLDYESHAKALLDCLEQIYREHEAVIGSRTLSFWRKAVEL
jgi:hypothetical protein